MSRDSAECLAFSNRLQVYAVSIENTINDVKVTSPFKVCFFLFLIFLSSMISVTICKQDFL